MAVQLRMRSHHPENGQPAFMDYCIQRLSLCDESERFFQLDESGVATIGTGADVSLRLHNSFGLPRLCLEIWVDDGTCIARNVTNDADLVLLNGQPLFDIVKVEDGDSLQIGSDQFLVLLVREPDTSSSGIAGAVASVADPPGPDRSFRSAVLNRSVARHDSAGDGWPLEDFLEHLRPPASMIQFINFRHAGVIPPRHADIGGNLFENAPAEVAETYSLHIVTRAPLSVQLELFRTVSGRDACVWGIPAGDVDSCVNDAKLYFAWLARPSALEMALQRSPSEFCSAILKPFRAIVIPESRTSGSWCVLSDPLLRPADLICG